MKKADPSPREILTHSQTEDKRQKYEGVGGEEVGYQSTWHLGQVDIQPDKAMSRYSSQTDKKRRRELSEATYSY